MICVEANGNCLFSSVCRAVDCPFEYQTIHLKCQLVMMLANHHNFLFPIFKASIAIIYGLPRMPEEEYLQKYNDGTLTQEEANDHNMPGPFSYLGYMRANSPSSNIFLVLGTFVNLYLVVGHFEV